MKKLILGAASVLAISIACGANAQTTNPTIPSGAVGKSSAAIPSGAPAVPATGAVNKPTAAVPSSAPAPAAPATVPLKKLVPAPTAKMQPLVSPPCAAPKPQAHKVHNKHHHKPKHIAPMQNMQVTFPPAQGCNVDYYCGTTTCPYVYHGGYFWYPHTQSTVLPGYTPSYWNGAYWYASRMHPHMLYIDGQGASYVVPLDIGAQRR
ncbi:MAG: hypothetical protein HYX35_05890 [Proteobacteria bacterium]|nr:hypothetical protein [Pseudomonadota bacterium]